MKGKWVIFVMYDAPGEPEIDAWMHGPHYDEVLRIPGVTGVQRYAVVEGAPDRSQYLAMIETEDIEATLAWRDSPEGQRSQSEANARGVCNRYTLIGHSIYASTAKSGA